MKTALIIIAIIIVAGGIGFVIVNNKDDSSKSDASSQSSGQQESSGQPESQPTSSNELDPNNYTAGAEIGETVDATDQKEVTISISDFIFETTYLKIKKGTKVTWVNNGNIGHTVTSDEGSPKNGLDSEILNSGDSYEFTFDEPGLYEYFCTPHPTQMRGVITVVE